MKGNRTYDPLLEWCLFWIRRLAPLVPVARRSDWRREWEGELIHRWEELDRGRRIRPSDRISLVLASAGAIVDVVCLIRQDWRIDMLLQDVRYAARTLGQRPGFTVVVLLILSLGIGANTVVFSVVDAVLFSPLPYPDPERLVTIRDENPFKSLFDQGPAPGNILDWRQRTAVFEGIGAWYAGEPRTVRDDTQAEKVSATEVTLDFFSVFGRGPLLGRVFDSDEVSRQDAVVVLGQAYWIRRFSGDPSVVGSKILIDEVPHEVLGVMPADFGVPDRQMALWLPWDFRISYSHLPDIPRDYRFVNVVARMRPGITIERAQADMDRISASLAEEHPVANGGWNSRIVALHEETVGDVRQSLILLFGAVGFVLLIACTNIANLLMARASDRRREMALRSAIGASRLRLVRQLLTESVLLSTLGGLGGIALAFVGFRVLGVVAPAELPRFDEIALDARVLVFALGVTAASGLIFGSLPAIHAIRVDLLGCLKEGTRGAGTGRPRRSFRSVLVVTEVAAALVLMIGAGLLIQSFIGILRIDPGYDPDNVLVARTFPDPVKYGGAEARLGYFDTLRRQISALPGVMSVGAATGLPLNAYNNTPTRPYWRQGSATRTENAAEADITMITQGFLRTMRIPLLSGRDFDDRDSLDGVPVVIVNELLAASLWPDEKAVGEYLMIDYSQRGIYPYQIVGVAGAVRTVDLKSAPQPEIYMPHAQVPYVTMNVVVRTSSDPTALAASVRNVIATMDPTQPVHSVTTMESLVGVSVAADRFSTFLMGVLSVLALVLATFGVYSVMAYTVSQRRHEIGVRLALGADRGNILGMVVRQSGALVAIGVALGLVLALVLTRTMSSLLYGVSAADPTTYLAVSVVLAAAAACASLVPARRAMAVDPINTLRHD